MKEKLNQLRQRMSEESTHLLHSNTEKLVVSTEISDSLLTQKHNIDIESMMLKAICLETSSETMKNIFYGNVIDIQKSPTSIHELFCISRQYNCFHIIVSPDVVSELQQFSEYRNLDSTSTITTRQTMYQSGKLGSNIDIHVDSTKKCGSKSMVFVQPAFVDFSKIDMYENMLDHAVNEIITSIEYIKNHPSYSIDPSGLFTDLDFSKLDKLTLLTSKQKLSALSLKLQQFPWSVNVGDFYTSTRDDLELYQIVDISHDMITTRYCDPDKNEQTVWHNDEFYSDFHDQRVYVPNYILLNTTLIKYSNQMLQKLNSI